MAKNSFVLYYNYKEQLEDLTNEQIGELLRAIFDYEMNGIVPDFNSLEAKVAFKFIKKDLDANREKYEEVCQKNRENVGKRWQNKDTTENDRISNDTTVYDRIPTDTNGYQTIPSDTKNTDNDNDNVNDNDNECVSNDTHNRGCGGVKPQKHRFGKYKNVLLTDAEYNRLVGLDDGLAAIEYLSAYRKMKGYKCKDDNLAIHKWVFTAVQEQRQREARVNRPAQKPTTSTTNPFLDIAMQGRATK